MTLFIEAKRELFPHGSRFECVGIEPDLEICPAAAELQRSVDTVLEKARKEFAK